MTGLDLSAQMLAHRHLRLARPGGGGARRGKGGCPVELKRLRALLARGLGSSAADWSELQTVYGWVHRAAVVLENPTGLAGAGVRQQYADLVAEMAAGQDALGTLGPAVAHFRKVTVSYEPGLFHCSDVPDLPRTNNDLEQYFGAARYQERRATGRKQATPGLVIRGAVRMVASLATRAQPFRAAELRPTDCAQWQQLRSTVDARHEARRAQLRFRRQPDAYLG
ncbi:MAG: hypothetical protein GEU73_08010 [Chloroflexi bacterium]|nr:hypothetical protein [Chloroflexota bacterium]